MTTTAQKIQEVTAPRSWGRDRPGAPARIAQMQTPSDRLRGHARTFMQVAVGLVPVPQFHDALVAVVGDLIDVGERSLKLFLESQPEWKRDGFEVQGAIADDSRLGALLRDAGGDVDALRAEVARLTGELQAMTDERDDVQLRVLELEEENDKLRADDVSRQAAEELEGEAGGSGEGAGSAASPTGSGSAG